MLKETVPKVIARVGNNSNSTVQRIVLGILRLIRNSNSTSTHGLDAH